MSVEVTTPIPPTTNVNQSNGVMQSVFDAWQAIRHEYAPDKGNSNVQESSKPGEESVALGQTSSNQGSQEGAPGSSTADTHKSDTLDVKQEYYEYSQKTAELLSQAQSRIDNLEAFKKSAIAVDDLKRLIAKDPRELVKRLGMSSEQAKAFARVLWTNETVAGEDNPLNVLSSLVQEKEDAQVEQEEDVITAARVDADVRLYKATLYDHLLTNSSKLSEHVQKVFKHKGAQTILADAYTIAYQISQQNAQNGVMHAPPVESVFRILESEYSRLFSSNPELSKQFVDSETSKTTPQSISTSREVASTKAPEVDKELMGDPLRYWQAIKNDYR